LKTKTLQKIRKLGKTPPKLPQKLQLVIIDNFNGQRNSLTIHVHLDREAYGSPIYRWQDWEYQWNQETLHYDRVPTGRMFDIPLHLIYDKVERESTESITAKQNVL